MSARTAARRRRQAVNGYRHLALIGRGNNNRPIIRTKSHEKQQARLAALIQKQRDIAMRKGQRKRR